jgi:MoaA/NifB/PqqE/SkfB family radical SAM enzyme
LKTFHSIIPINADPFVITWDVGRRCNYDCSYCPSHRHDNFSAHAAIENLKSTADFVFDYSSLIAEYRNNKDFHISFTGGEPTVHPKFIEFAEYLRSKYKNNFTQKFNLKLDLTTNGAMSSRTAQSVIDNFDYVTVSYHAEADDKLIQIVKARILQFNDSSISLKINVMFHANLFEQCVDFCSWLTENQIKFIPRLIGEDPNSAFSQAHLYTATQKEWLKNYWNMDISPQHRPCCGGRTFATCSKDKQQETKSVNYREFQGWHCSVNWYFLHIEQQTDSIFHHQTCQAKLDGTRGAIGTISQSHTVLTDLKSMLTTNTMPVIVCPNKLCGCGLCTPKSENRHTLLEVMPAVVKDILIFSAN